MLEVTALTVAALTLVVATAWMQQLSRDVQPSDWQNPNKYSSTDMVAAPANFDGDRVTFRGEVVGDAMTRGDGAWIHVNDDPYSAQPIPAGGELAGYNSGLPVWVENRQLLDQVGTYGSYRAVGDTVRVVGEFHAACEEHGGDIDIHATTLQVVSPGSVIMVRTPMWKVGLVAVLGAVAFGMWRLLEWRAARERGHSGGH